MIDINKLKVGRYASPEVCMFFVLKKTVDYIAYCNMVGFFKISYVNQDYIIHGSYDNMCIVLNNRLTR
jgi:hypothetical protein